MRPVRLELEGFASFRDRAEVDLEGADLFVLSGNTGAGKSSLIDAMVFSLYGAVPRYDHRSLVAPAITQGQQRARVRFTFDLGGERYTATRVVNRTASGGATTKEARLERASDGAVLAGSADELSETVEALLGLSFDHFTRTVVLPQGDFQEFLHAKPKERQELLVQLLDVDVYGQVAQRANQRAKEAGGRADVLRARLDADLAGATPEALAEADSRLAALDQLERRCDELRPVLERAEDEGRRAREGQETAHRKLAAVLGLELPDGVAELGDALAAAAASLAEATDAHRQATDERERAEAEAADLPPVELIRGLLADLDHASELGDHLTSVRQEHGAAVTALDEARVALDEAESAERTAAEELRTVERRHLAHSLRGTLAPGDACPVCERPIEEIPPGQAPDELEARRRELEAAHQQVAARRAELEAARARATSTRTTADNRSAELERLSTSIASRRSELGLPEQREAIEELASRASAAVEAVTAAKRAQAAAAAELRAAEQRRDALREGERAAWVDYDTARDRLATALSPSSPPPADRDDLAGSWAAILEWTRGLRPELEDEAKEAEEAIRAAEAAYRRVIDDLLAAGEQRGVRVDTRDRHAIFSAVTSAHATARANREQVVERLEEAGKVREELEQAERDAALAAELGKLLDAKHFQQWLLNRALRYLVVGASEILGELSSGAYALTVADDGTFEVVDHRNADEVRPAKTLSGGETFLASLALALALSDHVADLAAKGSARLDALFLDEGFGTLDADTLDTVATAIEELGARGRMVGLVTHVRDLAERIPVRFEVRRSAATSTVERVDR